MSRLFLALAATAVLPLAVISRAVPGTAQNTTPMPIPAGFDFPAAESTLLGFRDANDVAAMRRHAWMVFAGMTAPAAGGEAIWETWYSSAETFGPAPPPSANRRLQRNFQAPRQFRGGGPGAQPPAPGQSLASFVLFNEDAHAFIRAQKLNEKAKLAAINAGFTAQTPIEQRKIPEFPNTAISLKAVWWVVRRSGLTTLPVWDPDLNTQQATGNPPDTWKRCVAVAATTASIPASGTTSLTCNNQAGATAAVVPLDRFYHFAMTQAQVTQLRQIGQIEGIQTASAGDFLALIAFHYTTKEIADWVWATFWWHDKPDEGVFAEHRPVEVTGAWRNYLMAEAYSMDTPRESDSTARVAFNPWLEAGFRDGVKSNCMTCHRRSVFSGTPSDGRFLPITRGAPLPNDVRFRASTKLDFMWSVLLESR